MATLRLLFSSVVALAGCGFDLTVGATGDDGSPRDGSIDGEQMIADGAIDTVDAPTIALVDRGLVVRYFLEEAASGMGPANAIDVAPMPQSLPITYGQARYTEVAGNRGLVWGAASSSGKIEAQLSNTKIRTRLTPARTVTIEVVVQITSGGSAGNESQITGLRGSNPDFMLTALGSTDLRFFRPFGSEGATWAASNAQQRMVLHLVFDSTQATADNRIQLYRDGTMLTKSTSSPPAMGQIVGLGSSDDFIIGNRQQADRSIAGTIFYVAYYDVALGASEITNNAQRLLASDDE